MNRSEPSGCLPVLGLLACFVVPAVIAAEYGHAIVFWATRAAPWWFMPVCVGLAVFGFAVVVLWDALRPRGGA